MNKMLKIEPVIYIIDDDQAMTNSMVWILDSLQMKSHVFNCAEDFLLHLDLNQHGCILCDVRMARMSSLELQQILNERGSVLPIIFLTGEGDVALAVQLLKGGAIDLLTKPFHDHSLIESINYALKKDKVIRLKRIESAQIKARLELLSQREKQILHGIMLGNQNKIISSQLKISVKTVEAHRATMMHKLGAKSILQLAKIFLSHDLREYFDMQTS